MKTIAVTGFSDVEMETILGLLGNVGIPTLQATYYGEPITPQTAYQADPIHVEGGRVLLIECRPSEIFGANEVITIDHHAPHGRHDWRPERFLPASSIGQVIGFLLNLGPAIGRKWIGGVTGSGSFVFQNREGHPTRVECTEVEGSIWHVTPAGTWIIWPHGWGLADSDAIIATQELLYTAAADHCLGAAYRGECPGVDPDKLLSWRIRTRAAFQGRTEEEIRADIEEARAQIRNSPFIPLREQPLGCYHFELSDGRQGIHDTYHPECPDCPHPIFVRDMRRPKPIPELVEAAMIEGAEYVSGPLLSPDGKQKFTCSGRSKTVQEWMEVWAPERGLVGIYGNPERGFAGGYLP